MVRLSVLCVLACAALVGLVADLSYAADPEFRAVWVTRFEWPVADQAGGTAKIVQIMADAQRGNFNTVMFQCRGEADTLYPSPIEPWAPFFGKDPGWDPLKTAIDEAHKRGLQLHAYFNVCPAWGKETPPPNTTPEHIFNLHMLPTSAEKWWIGGADGSPTRGDNYWWMSPGVPGVQEHVRKALMDLVKRYEVDGVHFDRCRYPSPLDNNPIAAKRFEGAGNPNKLPKDKWQIEQMNRFVRDLSASVWSVKPKVMMSASVWGIYNKELIPGYGGFSTGLQGYCQDSLAWARQGSMDALCPMIYWDMVGAKPDYNECLDIFTKANTGRFTIGGMHAKFAPAEMKAEVEETRKQKGQGCIMFSYGSMCKDDRWGFFAKQVYPTKVPVPELPWKKNPTEGIVIGYVKDKTGKPVVDALVKAEGVEGDTLSGADGFFSLLKLKPGACKVSAQKEDAKGASAAADVKAGQVVSVDLTL